MLQVLYEGGGCERHLVLPKPPWYYNLMCGLFFFSFSVSWRDFGKFIGPTGEQWTARASALVEHWIRHICTWLESCKNQNIDRIELTTRPLVVLLSLETADLISASTHPCSGRSFWCQIHMAICDLQGILPVWTQSASCEVFGLRTITVDCYGAESLGW